MRAQFSDNAKDYKGRFRDLISNVTDKKNTQLKQRIVSGELAPAALVRMTAKVHGGFGGI